MSHTGINDKIYTQRINSLIFNTIGFTLIELLIVVAIIAILATIAIPNFLSAQVRAKVSRVKKDMQTIATGLESYAVDNNVYPLNDYLSRPDHQGYLVTPSTLTTPISYLGNSRLADPFATGLDPAVSVVSPFGPLPGEERYYTYQNLDNINADSTFQQQYPSNWVNLRGYFGKWRQASVGPDRDYYNNGNGSYLLYDPSNGTVSYGNVWLGQKSNYSDSQYNPNIIYAE